MHPVGGRRLSASLCTFLFPLIQAAPKARLFRILLVRTSLALCLNISSQVDRLVSLQTRPAFGRRLHNGAG